jgi:uncharacterized protein YkwD
MRAKRIQTKTIERIVGVAGLLALAMSLAGCGVVGGVNLGGLTGAASTTYTVQAGDCLSCIAARYSVTTQALIDANRGKYPSIAQPSQSNRIQVGWVLAIPAGGHITQLATSPVAGVSGVEPAAPAEMPTAAPAPMAAEGEAQFDNVLALEVVRLTNAERVKAGLNELIVDEGLMDVGRRRATEIVMDFSHAGLSAECAVCGENIIGPALASGPFLVEHWMNSPGHRASILDAIAVHTGVGVYRMANGTVYVSQVFAR